MRTLLKRCLILVALGLAGAGGYWVWRAQTGISRAYQYSKFELWPDARVELTRYLWLHPGDPVAHVAMAEALVKDDELPPDQVVEQATRHLRAVPDTSEYAAMARSQEGRLELFIRNRPYRAEQLFRHARDVNPRAVDPSFMIWKLFDLTGRSHLAEDEFWRVYEIAPPGERGERLREWYMSQFYPATANPTLDRLMGVVDTRTGNTARTEGQRFVLFRDSEPDGPVGYAALARWFQQEGDPKFALQILEQGESKSRDAAAHPFFIGSQVSVLIELGEFERAQAAFAGWPEPHDGYEFWLTRGIVQQEIHGEMESAVEAYDHALAVWPGQVDWRTMNRKATCLGRLKRAEELNVLRQKIREVEELTSDKLHRSLRQALGSLNDPDKLQPIIDFYGKLQRPREAQAWETYVTWRRTQPLDTAPTGSPRDVAR